MKRPALLSLLAVIVLGACAGPRPAAEARYSVVPKVDVKVKGGKKKAVQANYQAAPEDAPLSGSGGSTR